MYVEYKLSVRQTLNLSRNEEVRTLYRLTNNKNVNTDQLTINKNVNTNCLTNSIDITEKHLFGNKTKSVLSKTTKE